MTDKMANINDRAMELFRSNKEEVYRSTDRLFVKIMIFQWFLGIFVAWIVSPRSWVGAASSINVHVWAAIFLDGAIFSLPILLGIFRPAKAYTRHVIAVGEMLYCALLIHLTGGSIETHFQIFVVLAILSFYQDWRVLITASVITLLDHWLRVVYEPQSIFGLLTGGSLRWLEYAGWVIFEDIIFIRTCVDGICIMKKNAQDKAVLESTNAQLKGAMDELQSTQLQLLHAEKMASIGQLAAGVAHEINNPVGFISNNMEMLEQYTSDYTKVIRMVEELKGAIQKEDQERVRGIIEDMSKFEEEINLDFIRNDIGTLLGHNKKGIERIRNIVSGLSAFAREDGDTKDLIKVEEVLDSILSLVHSEIKQKAELIKNFGETKQIKCNAQHLGQVFVNLLLNAAQAIDERGVITIATYIQEEYVYVDISDTGHGIEEKNMNKIFDAFFTTKPIGQGTGLGLSISYEIVKKNGGDIKVTSKVGQGTTFTVMLPFIHEEHIMGQPLEKKG